MSPQSEPEGPDDEELDPEFEAGMLEWWLDQQSEYWEYFDVIARRNPYYGPHQPLVVEPITEEQARATYLELKRGMELRQRLVESTERVEEPSIAQTAPSGED
jgi:hypothetical protein